MVEPTTGGRGLGWVVWVIGGRGVTLEAMTGGGVLVFGGSSLANAEGELELLRHHLPLLLSLAQRST